MTRIVRHTIDKTKKPMEKVFSGDRDITGKLLSEPGLLADFKLDRLGGAMFPEGFIMSGLSATVSRVKNLCPRSEDFDHADWLKVNGATVTPAVAEDRYGAVLASRISAVAGQDGYIEIDCGDIAAGRKVVWIDAKRDTTVPVRVSLWDGVAEIALGNFNLTNDWAVYALSCTAWSPAATGLKVRLRPGPGSAAGTFLLRSVQIEDKPGAEPLTPDAYVATHGEPAEGNGSVVTVEEGMAYVHGLPRPFPAGALSFDPMDRSGTAFIYAEYAERYMDAGETRPELDTENGRVGQDEVREETALVAVDTTDTAPAVDPDPSQPQYRARFAVKLLQFDRETNTVSPSVQRSNLDLNTMGGQLHGTRVEPQSIPEDRLDLEATEGQPGLLASLARRLFNQSGNFAVAPGGMDPQITHDVGNMLTVALKVDPLDGYANGRAYYLREPKFLDLPKETGTGLQAAEGKSYFTGTATYPLNRTPVKTVNEVSGTVEVTSTVTKGTPGGMDLLPFAPVQRIVSVTQGATTYVVGPGGDVTRNGDYVDWSPVGAETEPVQGESYTVVYEYTKVFAPNEYEFDETSFTFLAAEPDRPINNGPFTVEYTYGQGRVDLIYLSKDGLGVLAGEPAYRPVVPATPERTMALWEVTIPHDSTAATIKPRFTKGLTMADLVGMQTLMLSLAYNVAQLTANIDLRDRNVTVKQIVTDPFLNGDQFDEGAAFFGGAGERVARIDGANGGRLLMARDEIERLPAIDEARTTMTRRGAWAGLPFTQVNTLGQFMWSKAISVNPYANADRIPPLITLSTQFLWWSPWQEIVRLRFTIRGTRFKANEAGIVIMIDNEFVQTVNADGRGEFTLTLDRTVGLNGVVQALGEDGAPSATFRVATTWPRRDPVAQTFVAPQDGDLTSCDLYFNAKGGTEPVTITLRTTQAGLPTEEILGLVTMFPADVKIAGQPTKITWPEPIAVTGGQSYALVAASNDSAYTLMYAKLGDANLNGSGGTITRNPYAQGVMVGSSDGRTWTAFQESDLRFAGYFASYEPNAVLYLGSEDYVDGISAFSLVARQRVQLGANLMWQYSLDADPHAAESTWLAFNPNEETRLSGIANKLTIRCLAFGTSTNKFAGVAINTEALSLLTWKDATKSSYVSLNKTLTAATTTVKAYVKAKVPAGCQAAPYATTDNGTTWVAGTLATTTPINAELTEYEYTFTLASGTAFRGRVDLVASTPTTLPYADEVSFVIQ